MPSFKLKGAKSQEVKSGFEPYDGPEPTRNGMYRGIIKVIKHGLNSSKSEGFSITLELEAAKGDPKGHAQFDGFPMFSRSIITESADGSALKEGAQRNLSNFLAALGTGDEPDVVLDSNDDGDKVNVLKIGGKKPVGAVVNVDVQMKMYEGERRPEVGGIYPYKEIDAPTGKGRAAALEPDEDDESDLMEDTEADETEDTEAGDDEFSAREEELNGLGIPALKKIAKELEIGISGTKAALVERILDAEFADEDDEDAADEDAEDEVDEADEAEDDEADDEDEDEDDEEEDDEEDAERVARVAELEGLDRIALKKILKEIAPDTTVLKRHTDADLREQILSVEFAEDLPF